MKMNNIKEIKSKMHKYKFKHNKHFRDTHILKEEGKMNRQTKINKLKKTKKPRKIEYLKFYPN